MLVPVCIKLLFGTLGTLVVCLLLTIRLCIGKVSLDDCTDIKIKYNIKILAILWFHFKKLLS